MTEAQEQAPEPEVIEEVTPVQVRQHRGVTQAAYDATRRERKAKAADVVKANAKEAQAAKRKALAKEPAQPGVAAFHKKAKDIEAKLNSKDEDTK